MKFLIDRLAEEKFVRDNVSYKYKNCFVKFIRMTFKWQSWANKNRNQAPSVQLPEHDIACAIGKPVLNVDDFEVEQREKVLVNRP